MYSNDGDKFWPLIFHNHSLAIYHQFSSHLDMCFYFRKRKKYPSCLGNKASKTNSEVYFTMEFDCVNFSCVKKEDACSLWEMFVFMVCFFLTSITGSHVEDPFFFFMRR